MRAISLLFVGLVFAAGLSASTLCSTLTTLQDYENAGVCSIGSTLFNFDPGAGNGFTTTDGITTASDVTVSLLGIGFTFTAAYDANFGSNSYTIDYDVQGGAAYFTGTVLSATGLIFDVGDGANASITKDIFFPTRTGPSDDSLAINTSDPGTQTTAFPFSPNLQSFHVTDGVNLNAGSSTDATMSSVGNQFTVPEPSTFVLFGATGLLIALFTLGRKKLQMIRILPVLAIGLVSVGPSMHASSLCTGVTLASLTNSTCNVGGLIFNFGSGAGLFNSSGTWTSKLTTADILVTAVANNSYGPGLLFTVGGTANATANNNSFFAAAAGTNSRTVTYNIFYTIAAPSSVNIIATKQDVFNPSIVNGGGTTVGAWSERDQATTPLNTWNLLARNTTQCCNTSSTFTRVATGFSVTNNIQLTASNVAGATSSFSSFDNLYSAPEPATFALIGGALLGLGFAGRKLKTVRN